VSDDGPAPEAYADSEALLSRLGLRLPAGLLTRALTHRSYAYENGGLPTNERLEFLGDAVLGLVVTDSLFRAHPDLPEGQLAKLRASVVNMRALAEVARGLGLGGHLLLGRGELTSGGQDKSSILADTLEALIGATYLHAGMDAAAALVHRLVDDLQELSRVEARAYRLDFRPVDVASIVHTVTKRLGSQAEAKHISLDLELAPDLPPVLADEDRAVQVLTNLTGNALQYTPENGRVIIRARREDGQVHITVQDTGLGIAPEHLPHIFDRFYRADKSRSRRAGGGSGIGLTIARALVEAHGGRIWAQSAGEGHGSTFSFTLQVAELTTRAHT